MEILLFKGFIHNEKELKSMLKLANNSSIEELMNLGYNQYGNSFFNMLNGHFAIVMNDGKKTIAIRDRYGTTSLYYTIKENQIFFSNTIDGLISKSKIAKELDKGILKLYLAYTYVPGEKTLYKDIYKVLPGYVYIFEDNLSKVRFFTPKFEVDNSISQTQWANKLKSNLENILGETKCNEASLLSSGVDSSFLCASLNVKETYTAHYDIESFSEANLAADFSKKIGAKHNSFLVTPKNYLDSVKNTMHFLDQPTGDASAEVLYLSCKEIGKKHSSLLSGEGIDELMFGYCLTEIVEKPKERNLKDDYIGSTYALKEFQVNKIMKDKSNYDLMIPCKEAYILTKNQKPIYQGAMVDILVWFDGNLLRNLERLGPINNVEIVTPYIDNRFYDMAMKIPVEYQHTPTKQVFRMAAESKVGADTAYKTKRGFPVPIRLWLRTPEFINEIKSKLNSKTAEKFFVVEEVMKIYDYFIEHQEDCWNWRSVWAIYCFIVWYEEHFN